MYGGGRWLGGEMKSCLENIHDISWNDDTDRLVKEIDEVLEVKDLYKRRWNETACQLLKMVILYIRFGKESKTFSLYEALKMLNVGMRDGGVKLYLKCVHGEYKDKEVRSLITYFGKEGIMRDKHYNMRAVALASYKLDWFIKMSESL